MAVVMSKYVTRNNAAGVFALSALIWLLKRKRNKRTTKPRSLWPANDVQYVINEQGKPKGPKAHVDATFFRQLYQLLAIGIPGALSPEAGFALLIAGSLVGRSLCDLWMIRTTTLIEGYTANGNAIIVLLSLSNFVFPMFIIVFGFSAIVNRDGKDFKRLLLTFLAALPAISVVNNILKYGIGEMKLRMRTNITRYLLEQYLKGFTYYKMTNLDTRIANPDQLLTTDIDKFCDSCTDLYSNIAKPMLDIGIYVYRLTSTLGGKTPAMMLGYLVVAGTFLTHLRKPIAAMTAKEQRLEGEYRHINSRLITNSEEVAFYRGNNREKLTLFASFHKLINHLRGLLEFKVAMGVIDNFVGKYVATVVGFYAVSMPFFQKDHPTLTGTSQQRFKHYYENGRMLVKLAEAIGRLILAGREMTRLAGFTARVTEIRSVLRDLNEGKYQRTMVAEGKNEIVGKPGSGRIIAKDNIIRFEHVPLVTPNGDVLIKDLSFEVKSGINVLVCGPNGCGKSSLFRTLGELWPVWGGSVTKPPSGKLFYIPQRPYMTLGTLRDQVIYPHTKAEMLRRGNVKDEDLQKYLDLVQLGHLLEREEGWNTVADWMDVLSGGEKQRIAMARLFYHKPQFAILDECTSAVSMDVEDSMYCYCREANITLFTVSHRRSLWKHHEYYLLMDGRGSYDFKPIEPDTEEFGS